MTAVVLSWNGREDTLGCLHSLRRVTYEPFEIVVVDNGSTDGSPDAVAARYPDVTLIRLDRNLGFAGGMNVGISAALEADTEYVITLNNDMEVESDFVEPLVAAVSSDARAAAACSQILFAGHPPRIWYAGARFAGRRGYAGRNTGYGAPPLPGTRAPYETERACGGAMLVSRVAIDALGLFDESLFAYAEDTDWSLRARAAGRAILVVPASVVRHKVSASSGGASAPNTLYYGVRNGLVVTERWAPLGAVGTRWRRLELVAAHAAQAMLSRRRLAGLRAVLAGWRDFGRGRLGERT